MARQAIAELQTDIAMLRQEVSVNRRLNEIGERIGKLEMTGQRGGFRAV